MYDDLKQELYRLRPITRDEPIQLYHYCDSAGLLGILESQKLWATHTLYLNDTTEINYTHELIEEIYLELIEQAPLDEGMQINDNYQLSYRGLLHRLSYKTMRPKPNNVFLLYVFVRIKTFLISGEDMEIKGLVMRLALKLIN